MRKNKKDIKKALDYLFLKTHIKDEMEKLKEISDLQDEKNEKSEEKLENDTK